MLIDIHCHILHGVDDGARSLADSIHMAEEALRRGIHKIIATPHHMLHDYCNPRDRILAAVSELQAELVIQQMDLELIPGQELRLTENYEQPFQNKEWQTLGSSPYLLVELPSSGIPPYFWDFVQYVHHSNRRIIIAHPERNLSIMTNKELAHLMIQKGILLQLNTSSLLGHHGQKIKKTALYLIKQQWIHFIASDAHGTYDRGFSLPEGYDLVRQLVGEEYAATLMQHAKLVALGGMIEPANDAKLVYSERI